MITKKQLDAFYKLTGHCLFGPSSLSRIKLCPAAALKTLQNPIQDESPWAATGTRLHAVMEEAFLSADPHHYIRNTEFKNSEEMVWCLDNADYTLDLASEHTEPVIVVEQEINLADFGCPEVEGTADLIIMSDKRIDVIDWKFGRGVQVFATDNIQAACYAAGALPTDVKDDLPVYLHIAQAPLNHFDGWVVTPRELIDLVKLEVKSIIARAMFLKPDHVPSMEACRFCNGRMKCDPRAEFLKTQRALITQASKEPSNVPRSDYIKLLDAADAIGQAIKDIRFYAEDIIRKGGKFGDYKLVPGRAMRKWIDEEDATKFLEEECGAKAYAPKKLVSVAQAEKINRNFKKDAYFQSLWEKNPGKPVLVKGSDKRKAIAYGAASAFAQFIE